MNNLQSRSWQKGGGGRWRLSLCFANLIAPKANLNLIRLPGPRTGLIGPPSPILSSLPTLFFLLDQNE